MIRCDLCRQKGGWFATGQTFVETAVYYPWDPTRPGALENQRRAFAICSEFCARKFWRATGGTVERCHDRAQLHLRWEPIVPIRKDNHATDLPAAVSRARRL